MMTYEEFAELTKNEVKRKLGDEYQAEVIENLKNNGVVETQLSIKKKKEGAVQCVYLKRFYELYKTEGNVEAVAEEILERLRADAVSFHGTERMAADIGKYSNIKSRILFKLVNTGSNQKLLKQIPSVPYLDLSIVFYLCLSENQDGMMSALIYNKHMEAWNVTVSDLYEDARKNTPHVLPETLTGMEQIIGMSVQEMMGETFQPPMSESDAPAMYVLSNTSGINGAAVILYPEVLKMCSEKLKGDFFILPSSIHETILIPCAEECDSEELKNMIMNVNDMEVPDTEILGDHAYRYFSGEDRVTAA